MGFTEVIKHLCRMQHVMQLFVVFFWFLDLLKTCILICEGIYENTTQNSFYVFR